MSEQGKRGEESERHAQTVRDVERILVVDALGNLDAVGVAVGETNVLSLAT